METQHKDDDLRKQILSEILRERVRQVEVCKFESDTNLFDKGNSKNDWVAYITAYSGRASDKTFKNQQTNQAFRENILKVAAICLAAIESHDRGWC